MSFASVLLFAWVRSLFFHFGHACFPYSFLICSLTVPRSDCNCLIFFPCPPPLFAGRMGTFWVLAILRSFPFFHNSTTLTPLTSWARRLPLNVICAPSALFLFFMFFGWVVCLLPPLSHSSLTSYTGSFGHLPLPPPTSGIRPTIFQCFTLASSRTCPTPLNSRLSFEICSPFFFYSPRSPVFFVPQRAESS